MSYKITLRVDELTKIEMTESGYPRELLYALLGKIASKRDYYKRICQFIIDYMWMASPQLDACEHGELDIKFPIMDNEDQLEYKRVCLLKAEKEYKLMDDEHRVQVQRKGTVTSSNIKLKDE